MCACVLASLGGGWSGCLSPCPLLGHLDLQLPGHVEGVQPGLVRAVKLGQLLLGVRPLQHSAAAADGWKAGPG